MPRSRSSAATVGDPQLRPATLLAAQNKPARRALGKSRLLLTALLLMRSLIASGGEAEIQNLMSAGETAFLKAEYQRALGYYNAALDQEPSHPAVVLYSRGLTYAKLKQDDKALRDFTEAIQLDPSLTVAYLDRGLAYVRQGLRAKAMADYNRAIAQDPANARAYRDRAELEDDLQLWENAINDYTAALQRDPKLADAYFNRGGIYARRHENQKAIADYTACLELDPRDPDAACELAKCYVESGDLRRATAAFTRLIRSHPDYLPAYSGRARVHLQQGDRRAALADARRGIALTPADAHEYYIRARLHQMLHDERSALADLQAAWQRDPGSDVYLNLIAWMLATSPDASVRDGHEAVRFAQQANEASGWRSAGHIDTLAAAYAEAGDFPKAIEYQERACALQKNETPSRLKDLQSRLALYRNQRPYREPKDNPDRQP